jgi:hypothetical protein
MARMDENPYRAPQAKPTAPPRDPRRTLVWVLAIALAELPFLLVGVAAAGVILHILVHFGLVR